MTVIDDDTFPYVLVNGILSLGDPDSPIFEITDLNSLCSSDACIVEISYLVEGALHTATGTSRRSPIDSHDERVAYMIALSRALEILTHRISKRAQGLVKHNDDVAQMKPEQRRKSQAYKETIAAIASDDDRVQRAAIAALRDREGSWGSSHTNECV